MNDQAGVDGLPESLACMASSRVASNQGSADQSPPYVYPEQARCFRASCVLIDNRFQFPDHEGSTALSV